MGSSALAATLGSGAGILREPPAEVTRPLNRLRRAELLGAVRLPVLRMLTLEARPRAPGAGAHPSWGELVGLVGLGRPPSLPPGFP